MTVQASVTGNGQELTIRIDGRFDFSAHQEFRDAYEQSKSGARRFVVDLRNASYLDSSALGMLLLLRDHAGGDSADIRITGCNADVRKILAISNFDQLFRIE